MCKIIRGIMKRILLYSAFLSAWLVNGYPDYNRHQRSPYSGDCGVQLTRGKGGGIYYAYPASYNNGVVYKKAASNIQSNIATGNRDYYGSYGRYPITSQQSGGNYNDGYRGSSYDTPVSSSSQHTGSSGLTNSKSNGYPSNYGSGYGSSSDSSYGGYSGSSSSNQGGFGSGWSQTAPGYDNDARFPEYVLSAHNSYRARHDTPPVTLDKQMSLKAQQWAEELASGRAAYGHSPDAVEGIYGESIQLVNNAYPSALDVMERWYDEIGNYNFKSPNIAKRPFNQRNSHFTAMIWYGTRKIGVGKATSPINGKSYVVVTYYPPGNIVDILEENVFPPRTT